MKQLPDEKELVELVEMAIIATQKARVMYETADAIATKWECKLAAKRKGKDKQEA